MGQKLVKSPETELPAKALFYFSLCLIQDTCRFLYWDCAVPIKSLCSSDNLIL